jgi:hypothetical protein
MSIANAIAVTKMRIKFLVMGFEMNSSNEVFVVVFI